MLFTVPGTTFSSIVATDASFHLALARSRAGRMTWLTTITAVENRPWPGGLPWGALDEPLAGATIYGNALDLLGWALGHEGPPSAIEVSRSGSLVNRVVPNLARTDVTAQFPSIAHSAGSGFHAPIQLPEEQSFALEVSAIFGADEGVPIASVRAQRRWRAPPPPGQRISVIIPCHNQARFLADAIESVLAQTYRPLEIIVVDDGSSDDPATVAARFGVRCIRRPRGGPSAARNTGLDAASGDYVVQLDGDNVLFPHALEANLHCFEEHPDSALVFGRDRLLNAAGTVRYDESALASFPAAEDAYRALLIKNYIGSPDNVMFRRSIFDAVGKFDRAVDGVEDYDLFLRVARGHPIQGHDTPVSGYRIHDAQFSRDNALMLRSALKALNRHKTAVRTDPRMRTAYRKGIDHWRTHFGDALVGELPAWLRARQWGYLCEAIGTLFRWYPRSFLDLLLEKAGRSRRRIRTGTTLVDAFVERLPSLSAVDRAYTTDYYATRDPIHARLYEALVDALSALVQPASVVDVGCGTGIMLARFAGKGIDVKGIEGSSAAIRRATVGDAIVRANLRRGVPVLGRFDLCLCIEVAEHLPRRSARRLVRGLTRLSDLVVFSAATPGREEPGHLNERPREYWIELFRRRGFGESALSDPVRAAIQHIPEPSRMHTNLMVFERSEN